MHHRIKLGYVIIILLAFGGVLSYFIFTTSKSLFAIAASTTEQNSQFESQTQE